MMPNVLKLNAHNYHQAYSIHCNGHSHPWSESVFADCFTDNYQAYALQHDDTVVGLYVALYVLDEATLMDIGVDAAYRGRGLSRVLMSHFLAQCTASDIHYVWLEVRASNLAAIGLYEAFGFEPLERRRGYYETQDGREDALMMRLTLNATE